VNFDLSNVTSLGFIVHWTIVIGIAVRVVMRARPVSVSSTPVSPT